eukprot:30011-Chlamydomonas_euryale.AAC.10
MPNKVLGVHVRTCVRARGGRLIRAEETPPPPAAGGGGRGRQCWAGCSGVIGGGRRRQLCAAVVGRPRWCRQLHQAPAAVVAAAV